MLRFAGVLALKSSWRADIVLRDDVEAPRPANDAPGSPAKTHAKKSNHDAALLAPMPEAADAEAAWLGTKKTSLGAGVVRPVFAHID